MSCTSSALEAEQCPSVSRKYLLWWAARAEDGGIVLDELLSEDVYGSDGTQRYGTLRRPGQVHPKHTCQIRGTHLINNALLRDLHTEGIVISYSS